MTGIAAGVDEVDWRIAEHLGIPLAEVCRMHPVERFHLWPARLVRVPPPEVRETRRDALLATLCAQVGSLFHKEGQPASTPWDYAPWLPRPKAEARPEGAGLADLIAGQHRERLRRERDGEE